MFSYSKCTIVCNVLKLEINVAYILDTFKNIFDLDEEKSTKILYDKYDFELVSRYNFSCAFQINYLPLSEYFLIVLLRRS